MTQQMIGIGTTEQSLTIRKCCICQKGFELKSNSHRLCSKKCANQSRSRAVPREPRTCKVCGEIFQPKSSKNILCSDNCRYLDDRRRAYERGKIPRMPKTLKPKECLQCGKTYNPKANSQRYCSPICNGIVNSKRNRSKINHDRKLKCWICKSLFKPKSDKSNARFCSDKCRAIHHKNKAAEKKEELEKEAKKEIECREKWNDASVKSSELPNDSLFSDEIQNFFKKGGLITKYINPVWVAGSQISQYEDDFKD
jgi:predicted nucleic acid-binding Zn ribbon protein